MCISNEAFQVILMHDQRSGAWVEDSRTPDSSSSFSTSFFLPGTLSLAAFWASKGWLPAYTPVDKFSLSGAPSTASSPTGECLLESSLPAGRGKRQEVRQRLGTQLQQPRTPFPPSVLDLWGRGSPGRKARAATSQRGIQSSPQNPPAILPSEAQHHGSSFGTILSL